ncbi:MAG: hypothetical protein WBR26_26550 [Candidatus Acidiferrum sp.]
MPPKAKTKNFARHLRNVAISIFVLFHVIAIACWCLPFNVAPLVLCRSLVQPYFLFTGLFQSWDMFSPVPSRTNSYLEAMLVYPDGTTEFWTFPRMDRLSFTERYRKERYRKFEETLVKDEYSDVWPDVARHIARQASTASRKPEMVMLIMNWSNLMQNPDGTFTDLPWQSRTFYRYRVEASDLP